MTNQTEKIELSIKDIVLELASSAKTIILTTILFGSITAIYSLTLAPVYQSTVLVTSAAKSEATGGSLAALTSPAISCS